MKASICLLLLLSGYAVAQTNTEIPAHAPFVIHAETGMQLDYFQGDLSSAEVVALTGRNELKPLSSTIRPSGVTNLNGNAPFFTIGFQRLIKGKQGLYWYMGVSSAAAPIANATIHADSTLSQQVFVSQAGDTIMSSAVQRWTYYLGLQGRSANLPIGFRLQLSGSRWRWLQVGLNVAPGLTLAHKTYQHRSIETGTVFSTPSGEVERSQFESAKPFDPGDSRNSPGTFFTFYASIPLHATFRPASRWQFAIGLEPGYHFLQLANLASRSTFMTRVSLGVRYQFHPNSKRASS